MINTLTLETSIYISICLLTLLLVVIILVNHIKLTKLNDRFKDHTIKVIDQRQTITDFMMIFINSMSYLLSYSNFMIRVSRQYDKYVLAVIPRLTKSIDYLSIKVLSSMFSIIFITFLSNLIGSPINLTAALIIMTVAFIIPSFYYKKIYNNYRKKLKLELSFGINKINSLLKEKYSLIDSIKETIKVTQGPVKKEFIKVIKELELGLDIVTVFRRLNERINDVSTNYLVVAVVIVSKTGSHGETVFLKLESILNNIKKLEEEENQVSIEYGLIISIFKLIPLMVIVTTLLFNPNYYDILFESLIGRLIIFLIIIVYLIYVDLLNKVTGGNYD